MTKLAPLSQLFSVCLMTLFHGSAGVLGIVFQLFKLRSKFFYVKVRSRPACLDDPSLGTHAILHLKKHHLHYVAKGVKGKPLMLFLHGFPEFWYSWRHQLREFGNDYWAVALDMRGYGESSRFPNISDYHMTPLMEDVKDAISELGYQSCVLVAHDWGGAVAWNFTLHFPNMVDQLICCNIPHPRAFASHLQKSKSQRQKSWYIFFFQLPWFPEWMLRANDLAFIQDVLGNGRKMGIRSGKISEEEIDAFKYTFGTPGALTGPVNYYRALMRYARTTPPQGWTVKCPTLVVWGTRDGALEQEMAQMSRSFVNDMTLHYVEGASHWVQQEEPELVNRHIRNFLKSKPVQKL